MNAKIKVFGVVFASILALSMFGCAQEPERSAKDDAKEALEVTEEVIEVIIEEPAEEEAVEEEPVEEEIAYTEPAQDYYEPVYNDYYAPSYGGGSGVLNSYDGINYYNGNKETYYSSNVLYHYMTPQWTLREDGVWTDSEGYVVVASSDLAYGSTVDTSLGMGKVYDSGCASGVVDIYTAW